MFALRRYPHDVEAVALLGARREGVDGPKTAMHGESSVSRKRIYPPYVYPIAVESLCSGAGTLADYRWTAADGWLVEYRVEHSGLRLGHSRHPLHPSLKRFELEDEARVIDVAMAWLRTLDFGDEATVKTFVRECCDE